MRHERPLADLPKKRHSPGARRLSFRRIVFIHAKREPRLRVMEARHCERRDQVVLHAGIVEMKFEELEPRATIASQLDDTAGPLVLLNVFTLDAKDAEQFLKAWAAESDFFSEQPGYISTQLHQGVGGTTMYVNYAVWESAAAFAAAFRDPKFKETGEQFPASVVALPHLVRKIAVPGYCVA